MKDDGNLDRTGEGSPPRVSPPRPPSSEDDLLAGRALDLNLLSREQLQEAVHEQKQSRSEGQSRSLCEILVLRGWLKTEDLSRLIKEQSRRDDGIPNLERYEIQERLGEGATAVVYRAWDRDLGRHVALKFMRGATVMSEVARQRFRREAQAAGSISHRNVIMIHDAGEAEGHPYLVMEIVEGSSLSEILQKKASPERGLLEILEKAARGMAAAHAKGVVHRDLKPANILVTAQGEPKVGDFGLAHLSDSSAHLTRTGTALGTPLYMAPEQAAGRAADISARTDVYALGAILYEMVAGRTPHQGDTIGMLYREILTQDAPRLRSLRPEVSADLEAIASKALDRHPPGRYADAAEFADDLRRYLSGEPILARPLGVLARLHRRAHQRRALMWSIAGAVVLVSVLALGLEGFLRSERALLKRTLGEQEEKLARLNAGWPARLSQIQGDVWICSGKERRRAAPNAEFVPGQGLSVDGKGHFAMLRFMDSTELELTDSTTISAISDRPLSGTRATVGKLVVLESGVLLARVPGQPGEEPVVVRTRRAELRLSAAEVRITSDPGSTRIEALAGHARVIRLRDGASADVPEGSYAVIDDATTLSVVSAPAEKRVVLEDFDGEDLRSWQSRSDLPDSTIRLSRETPGRVGAGALKAHFSIPSKGWAYIPFTIRPDWPRDWRGFSQLEFWFNGSASGCSMKLEVGDSETAGGPVELFVAEFRDSFKGWHHFSIPWSAFQRRDLQLSGAPNKGLKLAHVQIFNVHFGSGSGAILLDHIELVRK